MEENIEGLKRDVAVMREKVKRLESVLYGVLTFVFLQLVGLVAFWVKDFLHK